MHRLTIILPTLALALLLAACAAPTAQAPTAADPGSEPTATPQPATAEPVQQLPAIIDTPAAGEATAPAASTAEPTPGALYTTPHPILSDLRVRQAIAHCTDRLQLIEAVYPFISPEEQRELLMDTFLPQGHWALARTGITTYPFDPEGGQRLLEEAGWQVQEGANVRTNADGEPLVLDLLTTDSQFRQTWATVWEQQLINNCGIQIVRTHAPSAFVFGDSTGLSRRDFELGAFAWVGSVDPKGTTLYTCNNIPLPTNNWEGQNYMGWCNETASRAVIAANNTLDRAERIEQFGIVQREFTADMVSLPIFNRLSVAAAGLNLQGFRPDPTDYYTANIEEWAFADGSETVVVGMTQEPDTLFTVVDTFSNIQVLSYLVRAAGATSYSYDYQAKALTQLPTLENGGATLTTVEAQAGDTVWSIDGERVELAPGVEVVNADGETVSYTDGTVPMQQLAVTFTYTDGITWDDGEPLKQADWELGLRISCDPTSGAVSLGLCESRASVDFASDTSYTITYLPGALWAEYSVYALSYVAPSHQVLADGRRLADVPASEWATLPEVAETPLSTGPYRIVEWQKGQRIIFEANPYYYQGAPGIPNVVVAFIEDTNQAVAQLLNGSIDVLGAQELAGGSEVQVVLDAAEAGTIQAEVIASPTWEHVDMNQHIR